MKTKKRPAGAKPAYRVILINPPEPRPMKKRTHAKKRRHAKKNEPNPRRRRRVRRHVAHNPRRRRSYRRNPATCAMRAAVMGLVGGVVSELVDYGTDQISSVSPKVQGAISVGVHAAAAVGAAFIDSHLEAGLVATGVKTASQRIRVGMALQPKPVAKPTSTTTTTPAATPALSAVQIERARAALGPGGSRVSATTPVSVMQGRTTNRG